ncbi:hypothetical protein ABTE06_21800, partial [Acinetobacter baumannii]
KIAAHTATKESIEVKYEEHKAKLDAKKAEYHEFSLKLATIDSQVDACTASIKAATEAIESLAELKDVEECPVCHGVVGKENYHH